ncbi:MAG: transposase [Akkermansiaceae bacterium]
MPRQARVEYKEAIYHVMARGNRLDKIVRTEEDKEVFEQTLEEVVGKTGWVLYAYTLMGNHYHLVFKTPEANLVEGMTWFQSTVTKRHNARNRLRGHLFSGRYKAVLVEEGEYLSTLIHYVHLNAVRAKLIKPEDGIENYVWSSLVDYVKPVSKRRDWIAVGRGLAHLGYDDKAAGRRSFLKDTEGLIDRSRLKRAGVVAIKGANKQVTLERGWCFGSEAFREKMIGLLEEAMPDIGTKKKKANGYSGIQVNDHGENAARQYLAESLRVLGLSDQELMSLKKTDWRKAMIVRVIRRNTSVKLDWVCENLNMGARNSVGRAEQLLKKSLKSNKEIKKKWEIFDEMMRMYA